MQRVIAEARRQGVRISFGALDDPLRAVFMADQNLIIISDRLDPVQAADSGAHELGHHHYGDRCSTTGAEERAWIYAAKILISLEAYRLAELEDPHPLAIAQALGTTLRTVELYQRHHLQAQAMRAPRTIFGEWEDNGEDPDDAMIHSLAVHRSRRFCGLAS